MVATNPSYALEVVGDARVYPGNDFYVGNVGLNDQASLTSGASLLGLYDNTLNFITASTDVQIAFGMLDSALVNIANETLPPATLNGQTLRYNGTDWIVNTNLFNNGTNVGIGTTNPGYKLEIAGDVRVYPGSDVYVGSVGLNDQASLASGASLLGVYDNGLYNLSANTDVQSAFGQFDSAIGGRTYSEDHYVTDSQGLASSINALDIASYKIEMGRGEGGEGGERSREREEEGG